MAVAAICATTALLCAWWPAQIDGDWKNERIWGCMCGSGRHFLRFQGGKVIYYAPCEKRAIWIGSYTQIDANAYGISFLGSNESIRVRSGLLFLRPCDALGVTTRCISMSSGDEILGAAQRQRVLDCVNFNIEVLATGGRITYMAYGHTVDVARLEQTIAELRNREEFKSRTLLVYVDSDDLPPELQSIVRRQAIPYVVKTREELSIAKAPLKGTRSVAAKDVEGKQP